ncbi:hypothetical protein A5906_14350 [Bradyrhizobium sacchari]|nr:hypothetical protein A5906_14350 [Bradyrhizobium sacchari]
MLPSAGLGSFRVKRFRAAPGTGCDQICAIIASGSIRAHGRSGQWFAAHKGLFGIAMFEADDATALAFSMVN